MRTFLLLLILSCPRWAFAEHCVCPQWRYASFPTYYSYYSEEREGEISTWVSMDLPDDLGEFPNEQCCGGSHCEILADNDKRDRHVNSVLLLRGLTEKVDRTDPVVTILEPGVTIAVTATNVSVPLKGNNKISCRLIVLKVSPPLGATPFYVGHGLETEEINGQPDPEIPVESRSKLGRRAIEIVRVETIGGQPKEIVYKVLTKSNIPNL